MKNRKVHIEKLIEVMSDKEFWGLINEDSVTDKLIEYGYDYIDEENYKKAFKIFIFLTRLYSQNTKIQDIDIDILNGLGLSLSGLSRFKVSKTIFEKILESHPDDAITYISIAGLYWDQNDIDKAIYYYNKSLKLDPFIEETYFNLINLYYEQGDYFMAYISCLNLIEVYPENIEARETIDDLMVDMGILIS